MFWVFLLKSISLTPIIKSDNPWLDDLWMFFEMLLVSIFYCVFIELFVITLMGFKPIIKSESPWLYAFYNKVFFVVFCLMLLNLEALSTVYTFLTYTSFNPNSLFNIEDNELVVYFFYGSKWSSIKCFYRDYLLFRWLLMLRKLLFEPLFPPNEGEGRPLIALCSFYRTALIFW